MQLKIFEDDEPSAIDEAGPDYRSERNLARAAEYLVAFDISRRGWDCFTVGEQLRYDLIADVKGLRRIQVKSNRRAVFRAPGSVSTSYTFGSSHNLLDYAGEVDLFAFVAMDRMVVLYVAPSHIKRANPHIASSMFTPESSDLSWAGVMRQWQIDV